MDTIKLIIKSLLSKPFTGTKGEGGFALPLAVGTSMMAGLGLVWVTNRMGEAEDLMNIQLQRQSAQILYDQLERTASSSTALMGSIAFTGNGTYAKGNPLLKKCSVERDNDADSVNIPECTKWANDLKIANIDLKVCTDEKDRKIRKNCLSAVFGTNTPKSIAQLESAYLKEMFLYNSDVYLAEKRGDTSLISEKNVISGPYDRFGAKCSMANFKAEKKGCGRVFVRTQFGIECSHYDKDSKRNVEECRDASSIKQLVIYYAVYTKQKDGRYAGVLFGGAQPAVALCDTEHFFAGVNDEPGKPGITCNKIDDLELTGAVGKVGNKGKAGKNGLNGPQGPTGPRGYTGPRGPRW